MTGYCRGVFVSSAASLIGSVALRAQVDEGETQIINIRETDGRLGPLVFTLVALGCTVLLATAIFWWLTRPARMLQADQSGATQRRGDHHTETDV